MDKVDSFVVADDHRRSFVRDGKRLRAIAAQRKPDARARARRRPTSRRARPAGSICHACACRSSRAPNGGRCCARCGGCSATSSGCPTCRASTGKRCTRATRRCSTASRRAASCPTSSGRCRASSARRTRTRWAATTAGRRRWRSAISRPRCALADDGRATRSRASSRGDPWDAGGDSPLQRGRRRGEVGERIVAVNGQPRVARAPAAGAARAPGERRRSS